MLTGEAWELCTDNLDRMIQLLLFHHFRPQGNIPDSQFLEEAEAARQLKPNLSASMSSFLSSTWTDCGDSDEGGYFYADMHDYGEEEEEEEEVEGLGFISTRTKLRSLKMMKNQMDVAQTAVDAMKKGERECDGMLTTVVPKPHQHATVSGSSGTHTSASASQLSSTGLQSPVAVAVANDAGVGSCVGCGVSSMSGDTPTLKRPRGMP